MPAPEFSMQSVRGFTLVELMVTVLVVSILASIAVPTYTAQIRKSRRTEARTALLDAAAREERFYATNNFYTVTGSDLGYSTTWPAPVGSSYYSLTATCTGGKTPCPDYTLTATAINSQTRDLARLTLSLNQLGLQSATGAGGATTCWN